MKNLVTEGQAAEFIGVEKRTLQNWRYAGRGPRYVKISHRCVRYRPEDLEKFAEDHLVDSTSEETAKNARMADIAHACTGFLHPENAANNMNMNNIKT